VVRCQQHVKQLDALGPTVSNCVKRDRTAGDGVVADREALLAAAERLIRRRGRDVSLDAIPVEADVTKPTLYRGVWHRNPLVNALHCD
jgi:hypothetical protein